jgi:hypothetical protein
VSRTTSLAASFYQADPPFPGTSGSASDGTTSFDYYSHSISAGGSASQTSFLFTNGAFANVTASGHQNFSVMHPYTSSGTSTFTYVFDLTTPTLLYITGSLDRGSPFVGYGSIEIYNSANTRVYQAVGITANFTVSTQISDTYFAAPGQYRFVVGANNSGAGGGAPEGPSSARAFLTVPAPAPASALMLGALLVRNRRR